jgi:predicted Zn-dependent protease
VRRKDDVRRWSGLLIAALGVASLLPLHAQEAKAPAPPVQVLPAGGVSVESAALLMSGQEGGDIVLSGVALPIAGEAGTNRVLVRLRLDGPTLLAGQTEDVLRVEISLYGLDAGNGVQASLLETVEVDLSSLRSAVEQGGVDVLGGLSLRPGQYSLRLLARNLDTGRLVVRTLALRVPELADLDPAPPVSPPPAVDPRVTARSSTLGPLDPPPFPDEAGSAAQRAAPARAAAPAPSPLLQTAEGRKLRAAATAAYRRALEKLAQGYEEEALAAVAALEDSLLQREDSPVAVEDLVEIETGVAAGLAAAEPESLVPLLRLHRRLHEDATVRRRRQGSAMARESFLRLAELYRQGGRAEVARRFEATFADTLLRSGVRSRADQLFRRVLAEDPGNEIVLLELAIDAERHGGRAEAIGYLEELLRAQPNHVEARLRRALNLARLGRTAEAQEGYRSVIGDGTEDWHLRIAYQELGRMSMAAGLPGAERTLREGLARLPGDEKLTLLLAASLERSGLAGQAREVLAGFKVEGSDGGGAARHRYNRPPEELIEAALAELDREAAEQLPVLAAALERTAKK